MRTPWKKETDYELREIGAQAEERVEVEERVQAEEVTQKTVIEEFQDEVERTRQKVLRRLREMNIQKECIKVLSIVENKLDEKNGAKVSVACKGYGKYTVDGEEIIINKDITMEVMLSVIDMVPAFNKGEPTTTIEPKVDIWFSIITE